MINAPEPCEHMREVIAFAIERDVMVDGCGCCGSPIMVCNICNVEHQSAGAHFPAWLWSFEPSEDSAWDWTVKYGQRVVSHYNGGHNAISQVVDRLNRNDWRDDDEIRDVMRRLENVR